MQGKLIAEGYLVTEIRGKQLKKNGSSAVSENNKYICFKVELSELMKSLFDAVLGGFTEDTYTHSGRLGQKQHKDLGIR